DTGIELDNLVTFQLSPALNGYSNERATQFYTQLLDRLRSAPGVKSAAKDGEDMQAFMNSLSPQYFETMKIPLLEGRDFRQMDIKQGAKVAIVNRKFAE